MSAMGEQAGRDLIERASSKELEYRGFQRTSNDCLRCGRSPDFSGKLHLIHDPIKDYSFEFGVYCFPTYIVPALRKALRHEIDETRKSFLEKNLKAIISHSSFCEKTGRCNIAKTKRNRDDLECELPASECIAGGYAFRIQQVCSRNFTIRVYDDELSDLGRQVLRSEAMAEQDITSKRAQELIAIGEAFRKSMHPGKQHRGSGYKVCKYATTRIANRDVVGR